MLTLCLPRRRLLGLGLTAVALALATGGCGDSAAGGGTGDSGSGSGDSTVYEGTAPAGGTGPENLEPLLPIRPGLRLDLGSSLFAVTAVSADGSRASTTRGPMVKTAHGWAIEDVMVTNQNLINAAGELVAWIDGAILVVPDTVRVGMTWTSGPWDYEVTAREEGVETPFGPRTVWDITVGHPGQTARYAEGIGYLSHGVLGSLQGGTVPLDDTVHPRPASPNLPLVPLFGGEPLPLGEGLQMNVVEAEDGLAVAIEQRSWHYDQFGVPPWELVTSWECMGVFGQGQVVDIRARDDVVNYGNQVIDYDAPIPRSCQLHGRPPPENGFDNEHQPNDLWIGPNGDMFYTGGAFGGFGEAGAFQPTTINPGSAGVLRLFSWLDRSRGPIDSALAIPADMARTQLISGFDMLSPHPSWPNALVKPDLTSTSLSMVWLGSDGRTSYSVLDLTVPEFRAPVVGRAMIGLRTPSVRPGARDMLYFDPEEGILDELVVEDEGYRMERVASFELPTHHRLIGAARMGATSPGHVLVVTSLVAPAREFALAPDARETYFWQLELPDGSGADVSSPAALAVLARHSGHDAIACWPPSDEPLQTEGWSLGGVPARGVHPLETEPHCALVLRDLATWSSEAAWLEGPIPGVGRARVTVQGEMPPRVGRGVISQGVLDKPVVTTNGLIVDGHTVDAWGIPKLTRELYGHPDQVGDASGAGAWLWVRESYFEPSGRAGKDWLSFFLGADGVMTQTQLEAHAANPIEPSMGPALLDGGILTEGAVLHLDGSYEVIDLPALYPGGHVRLLDGTWCTQGTLSVRCLLPDDTVVEYEPDWGTNTFMYGLHPLPSGLLFVALSKGSGLLDPVTGETWLYETPNLRDVEVHPGPRLVASDDNLELWELTDSGPVRATHPELPADAGGVRDHFITETTELLVTKDGDLFRFAR